MTLGQILDDYHSQIAHLAKELEQIRKDWTQYEQSKSSVIMNGRRR